MAVAKKSVTSTAKKTAKKAAKKTAKRAAGKPGRKTVKTSATKRTPARKPGRATTSKSSPGRRESKKEATQKKILEVALRLFETRGFERTTTREIAKGARIAEGTLFNYFSTKDDIALYFFELEVEHAISAVRGSAYLRKAPVEEKLFALVQNQIDFLAPYERFIGAAFMQALRPASKLTFSPRALALRAHYLEFVEELLEEASTGPRTPATWIAPHAFWLLYVAILFYWLYDTSDGKQSTLAMLDRSLRIGVTFMQRSGSL